MSKFQLCIGEFIQKIETPIMSGSLHNKLYVLKDLSRKSNIHNGKILFNLDSMHIDNILIRGSCCLLLMYVGERTSNVIDTPIKLWSNLTAFQNLHVFHYEQDLERDTFIIRPVLSANLEDNLSITLGDPITDKWKIIKGIYL